MTSDEYRNEYLNSPHWYSTRKTIYRRAAGTCERCGLLPPDGGIHHHDYRSLGRETPETLTALCTRCHKFVHGLGDDPRQALTGNLDVWRQLIFGA